ncbi:dimethylsulfoniopropionate demethylase [Aliiroseovarius sp. KMU-50]|uniref:Dimethylsulfoniopropionate demethylase n=1 Tax=Aliiroseovarius salicola TaxID=3009082 RepID=A0ABT4W2F9_9RHOB|nr:dimethylsulfoniopropionate demethylase [Aliiroseovarius sp. KMU-50]MDA5094687.1 dimethylsulfoniopropionate demethylase [Aliiroseovarius sp. KMU-50]
MALISPSRRLRRTPFTPGVEAAGVKGYTVYNHMLLPTVFRSVEEDYRHLKTAVQVWDVSCERQVSIRGRDARRMMELLSPRDLSKMQDDQCYYIPVVDRAGGMLNDPVAVKRADDHYWISIADGDFLQYALGVADGMGLDVEITEPDVCPLAIQGPKADDLMTRVFGDQVREIRFFRYKELTFEGHPFVVARSGYSKQGGFEIYVDRADLAMPLWDALFAAGEDLNVWAGCPNLIERIEGGLLSFGNDMTRENSPFEAGLGKFVNASGDYLAKAGLAARANPDRMIRPIEIEGDLPPCDRAWPLFAGDTQVGNVTSAARSPDFNTNVAIGMVEAAHWAPGTTLRVETLDGAHVAHVRDKFWI